jgi:hypothetical protein
MAQAIILRKTAVIDPSQMKISGYKTFWDGICNASQIGRVDPFCLHLIRWDRATITIS